MISRKRTIGTGDEQSGCVVESNSTPEESISDLLKRVRFSRSPGELRLEKELTQLRTHGLFDFEQTLDKSEVLIHICLHSFNGICRCSFRVKVLKYYPHDCPLVSFEGFQIESNSDGLGTHDCHGAHEPWTKCGSTSLNAIPGIDMSRFKGAFVDNSDLNRHVLRWHPLVTRWDAMGSIALVGEKLHEFMNECLLPS
jgi:hypothetical protein